MPSQQAVVGFEMEMVWVPIIVAIISGPLVVVLQKLRKENTSQHAEGQILLRMVGAKVDKIDSHIGWHEGKKEE